MSLAVLNEYRDSQRNLRAIGYKVSMKTKLSQTTVLPKKPKTNQLHREPMPKVDDIVTQYTIKCPLRIGISSNKKLNTMHLCLEST